VLASDYDKQNIIREGIKNNLHVIHNGINVPTIERNLSIPGTENYKKIVLCIARISPQKRFESYIKIAELLPQYAFVWIGADKDYKDLPSNVICLKGFPNASKYIQVADLFVLPSNYEGIPIVVIDALSYAKPVVSSNVGGISEIVINEENGFVLDNKDSDFVDKIEYILENNSIYKSFCNSSSRIFYENLTIEKMVEKYLYVYEN
jgi:glycosyltransferase involved in cell wall biosynthesis